MSESVPIQREPDVFDLVDECIKAARSYEANGLNIEDEKALLRARKRLLSALGSPAPVSPDSERLRMAFGAGVTFASVRQNWGPEDKDAAFKKFLARLATETPEVALGECGNPRCISWDCAYPGHGSEAPEGDA